MPISSARTGVGCIRDSEYLAGTPEVLCRIAPVGLRIALPGPNRKATEGVHPRVSADSNVGKGSVEVGPG